MRATFFSPLTRSSLTINANLCNLLFSLVPLHPDERAEIERDIKTKFHIPNTNERPQSICSRLASMDTRK